MPASGRTGERERPRARDRRYEDFPAHACWHRIDGGDRTRIELPPGVPRPFEVFVNGVAQVEGADFEVVGACLYFPRVLRREGRLGFWRWTRMALGIAGSYRQNDTVDVVYAYERKAAGSRASAPPTDRGRAKLSG